MDPIWDPMWLAVRYLLDRAYCRARAALDGNPESGALTLEWLVIAGILVGAAALTATFLRSKISAITSHSRVSAPDSGFPSRAARARQ